MMYPFKTWFVVDKNCVEKYQIVNFKEIFYLYFIVQKYVGGNIIIFRSKLQLVLGKSLNENTF